MARATLNLRNCLKRRPQARMRPWRVRMVARTHELLPREGHASCWTHRNQTRLGIIATTLYQRKARQRLRRVLELLQSEEWRLCNKRKKEKNNARNSGFRRSLKNVVMAAIWRAYEQVSEHDAFTAGDRIQELEDYLAKPE
mmetsp:Transcript_11157/g.29984  ORF Transcript_11157/g.29984 Transcript_11157/m.29984 type:complete len:141 (+) Transcript_11157:876-1298(+)